MLIRITRNLLAAEFLSGLELNSTGQKLPSLSLTQSVCDSQITLMSLTMYTSGFSKQQLHSRYVLQLLLETWKLLRGLPNINRVSTCHSKEITVCGKNARHILLSLFLLLHCSTPLRKLIYELHYRWFTWTVRGLATNILQGRFQICPHLATILSLSTVHLFLWIRDLFIFPEWNAVNGETLRFQWRLCGPRQRLHGDSAHIVCFPACVSWKCLS